MKVSVFGLGYVGSVTAACLASLGHRVIGVDINPAKVEAINCGQSPLVEASLAELIALGRQKQRLLATLDAWEAVHTSDISLICVGTPSERNGQIQLEFVQRVATDIGRALRDHNAYHVVVVRSTLLPGMAEKIVIPLLEQHSGKYAGADFGFVMNPEFLREGTAIADFMSPPYTLVGELDQRSGDAATALYEQIDAPLYRVPIGVAEMAKYASNTFHALKVTYANEIGNFCKSQGINSQQVMEIFVQDTRLNLSPSYLKPGFAFGGSCLGKDLRALLHSARHRDLRLPVLEAILPSNELQILRAFELIERTRRRKVGLIGLSFKAGTDDLRESPTVELAERLLGKGYKVEIFDPEVALGQIHGSNKAYIEQAIPHIHSLMTSSLTQFARSEVIVVAKNPPAEWGMHLLNLLTPRHILIDLIGSDTRLRRGSWTYEGICW